MGTSEAADGVHTMFLWCFYCLTQQLLQNLSTVHTQPTVKYNNIRVRGEKESVLFYFVLHCHNMAVKSV